MALFKGEETVSFSQIEDPRIDRNKKYPINEIIFLSIVATLSGVQGWTNIETFGEDKLELLQKYFPYKNGIPSHDTLGRVFSILKPKTFEQFFSLWTSQYIKNDQIKINHIAIDGKTSRGSKNGFEKGIHLLNVCSVETGLAISQKLIDNKVNESVYLPEILEELDIKHAIITADALNTQVPVVKVIINESADYNLPIKENQKRSLDEIKYLFEEKKNEIQKLEEADKSHGRLINRRYEIIPIEEADLYELKRWDGLKAIGRATNINENSSRGVETKYFILSFIDLEKFAKTTRGHWAIENNIHWVLDVIYGEDGSRVRKDHAPRNYSIIRKLALNISKLTKGKLTGPNQQVKLIGNVKYLEEILEKTGFVKKI